MLWLFSGEDQRLLARSLPFVPLEDLAVNHLYLVVVFARRLDADAHESPFFEASVSRGSFERILAGRGAVLLNQYPIIARATYNHILPPARYLSIGVAPGAVATRSMQSSDIVITTRRRHHGGWLCLPCARDFHGSH
jgi:hypothetical protein